MPRLAQQLLAQIPKSVVTTHLKLFLQNQTIGTCTLSWSEPTVGLHFKRLEKEPGAYYRDPYPLTVCAYSSVSPHLPVVEAFLDFEDIQELLISIQ